VGEKADPTDRALTDRAWRGYDPRAGFPAVATAAVVSAVLLSGRWYFEELSWFAEKAGALAVYAMTLAVWPGLLSTLLYRAVTYTYRLTDRAVLIDWGFRNRPEPPVWLKDVTEVAIAAGWVGQQLGIGTVTITAAGGRVVALAGVANPAAFAEAIRTAAGKVKAAA
jgi:membrane protein YdbS with pleckstrin-like domain